MYRGIPLLSDSDWGEFLYTFELGLWSLELSCSPTHLCRFRGERDGSHKMLCWLVPGLPTKMLGIMSFKSAETPYFWTPRDFWIYFSLSALSLLFEGKDFEKNHVSNSQIAEEIWRRALISCFMVGALRNTFLRKVYTWQVIQVILFESITWITWRFQRLLLGLVSKGWNPNLAR